MPSEQAPSRRRYSPALPGRTTLGRGGGVALAALDHIGKGKGIQRDEEIIRLRKRKRTVSAFFGVVQDLFLKSVKSEDGQIVVGADDDQFVVPFHDCIAVFGKRSQHLSAFIAIGFAKQDFGVVKRRFSSRGLYQSLANANSAPVRSMSLWLQCGGAGGNYAAGFFRTDQGEGGNTVFGDG